MQRDIQLLDTLFITDDGETAVLLSSAKGCALLAYLIVRGRTEFREHVADLLWDANSTAEGLRNLRVLLTRIRAFLPDVVISRKELTFVPIAGERIDYLALTKALQQKDVQTLLTSLQLYRGNLLADFYLDDAPRFQEWLVAERERLHREVLDTHRWLCQTLAETKQWEQGVATAVHWLTVDDVDEEAIRWLMRFLAAEGQTAVALTEYEQFHTRLQDQLGIDPEPETRRLAYKLREAYREMVDELFAGVDFATRVTWPSRDTLAPVGLLPTDAIVPFRRNPHFIGREKVLLQLADWLLPWPDTGTTAVSPTVVINGIGGLGKTQTAVEFCYRYGRYFPGGVFWLNFAEADTVAEEVAVLGSERGLGLFHQKDQLTLAEQVGRVQRAWQEPIPRLLIFDNCEDEVLLANWLPVTGGCRVLVTSCHAQWSSSLGVVTYRLNLLTAVESVALLQYLAPTLAETDAVEMATELGHLPLALHLAGSFLGRYSQVQPAQYLAELQDKGFLQHPSLQGYGIRLSPTGHDLHVARTFAITLYRLDESNEVDKTARQLLACAACFAPDEPIPQDLLRNAMLTDEEDETAKMLAEDSLTHLAALGFLEIKGQNSVVMHQLLAAFVGAELADDMEEARLSVENAVIRVINLEVDKSIYIAQLPLSTIHLQHLVKNALPRMDRNAALLVNLLGWHFMETRELQRARLHMERALEIQSKILPPGDPDMAITLNNLGTLLWQMEDPENAWPYYEQALHIYKSSKGVNHPETARLFNNLAILYRLVGNFATAQSYFERALHIFEQMPLPDQAKIATVLYNLGITCSEKGDYKTAKLYYERDLRIREDILEVNYFMIARSINALGTVAYILGEYEEAMAYFKKSLALNQKVFETDHSRMAPVMHNIGMVMARTNQYEEGQRYFEQVIALREKVYGRRNHNTARSLSQLGYLHLQMGNYTVSRTCLQEALSIQRETRFRRPQLADTLTYLGDLCTQIGDLENAKEYLEEALAIREQIQGADHLYTASTLISLGEWYHAAGNQKRARSLFERALSILEDKVASTHISIQRVKNNLVRTELT